ncbi:MAG: DUF6157 family protein [Propionibacteriaceae bacterium]|jgi:hypothetical protein|nr:DUF6157 family protein [Propionibacteriaceae bacterium]
MSTTNYINAFIAVAEDCPVSSSEIPPSKQPPSAAQIAFEMLNDHPYEFTSDDVLYAAQGEPKGMSRELFFSRPQPCFRSSPLTKRYGWGIHSNAEGKIALVNLGSDEYEKFEKDTGLRQLKGMRSKRA